VVNRREAIAGVASLIGGNYGPVERPDYDTCMALAASNVSALRTALWTGGYAVAGDGGAALYRKVFAEPAHAGKVQSLDGAWWELAYGQAITPQMFGASANGVDNDSIGLQAFFDYLRDNQHANAVCVGDFALSEKLIIGHLDRSAQFLTRNIHFNAKFTTNYTSQEEAIRFCATHFFSPTGRIWLNCGSHQYASRRQWDGIIFDGCSSVDFNCHVYLVGVKRWGIRVLSPGNSGRISHYTAQYCGSNRGGVQGIAEGSFGSNTKIGSVNSIAQRSVLGDVEVPPELFASDYVVIDGNAHQVTGIDTASGTVEVVPWVIGDTGKIRWAIGGSISFEGNDANIWRIDSLASQQAGCGVRFHNLYPASIGSFHSSSTTIGMVLGSGISAACLGGAIENCYIEGGAHDVDYFEATGSVVTAIINTVAGFSLSRAQKMAPNNGADYYSMGAAITAELRISGRPYRQINRARNLGSDTPSLKLGIPKQNLYGTMLTITLDDDPEMDRAFGINEIEFTCFGSGANGQPTGMVTIKAGVGTTANGAASVVFSDFSAPPMFRAYRKNGATPDWIVTLVNQFDAQRAISIDGPPAFVGQTAVVAGVGYMATGTNSSADWKQVTN
jgi:hypothetical protein